VPHSVVGTTVSGIGTSLPELTIALMAAKRSKGVAIGTLIGSNITDPLLSIGIASMIHPLSISTEDNGLTMEIIAPATVLGVLLALIFMRRSYRFERWEGACLALFYLVFLVVLQLNR
jgi:cation:H+ antiporter